ncbi:MAG: translocase [Acidobacteria bacterium]|nr:translocase [Acidobacteriota bacterium]
MVDDRPEYQSRPEIRSLSSFPSFKTIGEKPKGPLEKMLSFFADVRAGEGAGVLLLLVNVFLTLFAYYLLKTVREALILTEGGAYIKAYSSAGQAALLIAIVPLYGYIGTKVVRVKLLAGLSLFFILNLILFYSFGVAGYREGVVFYIWVGIFNVFVVSQFWAFANDLYTEAQGKRLFPMIGVGSSLGAWLGAETAGQLVKVFDLSPYQLQLIAAAILAVCIVLTVTVNRIQIQRSTKEMAAHADQKLGAADGFQLIFKSRYLTWIAILIVLLNIVNSSGEFLLGNFVAEQAKELHAGDAAAQKRFVGAFYGRFFGGVNLLGFLLQTFAVSRIFASIGVRGALFVLPIIALVSYSVLAIAPIMVVIRVAKTLENATDYSLQNTIRQALFLPTSREAKYKAKAAIDTVFMRLGDVIQAGIVKLGAELHLAFSGFAWLNIGFTVIWIWISARVAKEHRRLSF